MTPYHELIAAKRITFEPKGLANVPSLNGSMNPHQEAVTEFALRQGCATPNLLELAGAA